MKHSIKIFALLFLANIQVCFSQVDTFKAMSYNVLNYGDNCQNPPALMHPFLKNIVQFAKPDLLGLVKLQSIKTSPTDFYNLSVFGFADSIEQFALNTALPNTFAHCPFTNSTQSNTICALFYNKNKFGYVSFKTLCTNTEDFNLFKLFLKDTMLARVHDTTFLYVILSHTQSGNNTSIRDDQDTTILHELRKMFGVFPNIIYMGDFNTSTSTELGYYSLTHQSNTAQKFFDPPFSIDNFLSYPLNWGANPSACAKFLTTSTRSSATKPNTCGTSGGGKNWYDHILLSEWIKNSTFNISYLPHSYSTIGNDGNRVGISVNDSSNIKNTSASSVVVNSMFNFSNKYPVMASFKYAYKNSNPGASAEMLQQDFNSITAINPTKDFIQLSIPENLTRQNVQIKLYDITGKLVQNFSTNYLIDKMELPIQQASGLYLLSIQNGMGNKILKILVTK